MGDYADDAIFAGLDQSWGWRRPRAYSTPPKKTNAEIFAKHAGNATLFKVGQRDGNRKNPRLSNLRYGTRQENIADAWEHGTRTKETSNSAKAVATKDKLYPGWRSRIFGRGFFKEGGTAA